MNLFQHSTNRFILPPGEVNEVGLIAFRRMAARALLAMTGGLLLALALPPCGLWFLAPFSLTLPMLSRMARLMQHSSWQDLLPLLSLSCAPPMMHIWFPSTAKLLTI